MSEPADLDVEMLLFFQTVIDVELETLDHMAMLGEMGMADEMTAGLLRVAYGNLEGATAELDRHIADDATWRPA